MTDIPGALDLDLVRAQFPAMRDGVGDDVAFFENAGGSFPCQQVIDRLTAFYSDLKVQPGHPYPLAERAWDEMVAGPARLAPWLGVQVDELHVGPSTTQNTYVLAEAFRQSLPFNAAIVVTNQDHEANTGPWRRLASSGFEVREWRVDPETGALRTGDLEALLDDRVAVVAFPAASNVLGACNPVAEWTRRAQDVGAVAVVDAVADAPHGLPDVEQWGADIVLFSTYKTYGPHQGVMTVRRELAERLPNQGHFFNAPQVTKRLTPAGPDHAQVAALGGIVDYLEVIEAHHFGGGTPTWPERRRRMRALWHGHEAALATPLLEFLDGRADVRLLGPASAAERHPTISFVTERPAVEVARELGEHGIGCAGGHFYAHRLVDALGVDPSHGVVRLSAVHNTSPGEVGRAIAALDAVL